MPPKKPVKAIKPRKTAIQSKRAPSPIEALAMEVYSVLCRGLTLYGLSIARQRKLFKKAIGGSKISFVSESILQQFHDLSSLLTTWLEELPYIDATGRPKILPIRGPGATFESLARQFLPQQTLEEVLALACEAKNVGRVSGGRITIYGEPMVKVADNPEAALAQIVSHITNIINTVEVNKRLARRNASAGRLERVVKCRLSPAQFEVFGKLIRPQLNAWSEHADHVIKSVAQTSARKRRKAYTGGIGIYLYLCDDNQNSKQGRRVVGSRAARRR